MVLQILPEADNRASVPFLRKDIPRALAWDNPFPQAAPKGKTIPRKDYIQNTYLSLLSMRYRLLSTKNSAPSHSKSPSVRHKKSASCLTRSFRCSSLEFLILQGCSYSRILRFITTVFLCRSLRRSLRRSLCRSLCRILCRSQMDRKDRLRTEDNNRFRKVVQNRKGCRTDRHP